MSTLEAFPAVNPLNFTLIEKKHTICTAGSRVQWRVFGSGGSEPKKIVPEKRSFIMQCIERNFTNKTSDEAQPAEAAKRPHGDDDPSNVASKKPCPPTES
ncbi:unnamed protein product [Caenorhabditis bovis]|uniref:Uncharacterized protein n=1 Tax=Caenorhabditis bovis TaxID=2654633 RepID=A0A8S1F2X9_9PELO|nr:unnamed protein product [Caenorhabditis bovis]